MQCDIVTRNRRVVAHPDADLRKRLDSYSEASGVPVAEIVRRALDDYLRQQERATGAQR